MEIYDLHCHIDLMPSMTDFANEASSAGIGILAVTTTPKAYEKEVIVLRPFTNIKVALGLHPQLISERYDELSLVEKNIDDAGFIGEIGLDFNRQFYSSKEKQIDVFDNIVNWCSQKGGKVISIHSVHSDKAVLDIIGKHHCTEKNKCILHWYSGSIVQLHRAIEMGCFFSINGTMIKSLNGQKLIKNIPPEKILIESDAPFVEEVKNVQQLKIKLKSVESSLISVFSSDIADLIHNTSKALIF